MILNEKITRALDEAKEEIISQMSDLCKEHTRYFNEKILKPYTPSSSDPQAEILAKNIIGKFGCKEEQVKNLIEVLVGKKLPWVEDDISGKILPEGRKIFGLAVIVFNSAQNSHNYGIDVPSLPGIRITSDFKDGNSPTRYLSHMRTASDEEIDEMFVRLKENDDARKVFMLSETVNSFDPDEFKKSIADYLGEPYDEELKEEATA